MNTGSWIVQGPLALLFLLAGGMKVCAFSRFKRRAAERSPEKGLGYSQPVAAMRARTRWSSLRKARSRQTTPSVV